MKNGNYLKHCTFQSGSCAQITHSTQTQLDELYNNVTRNNFLACSLDYFNRKQRPEKDVVSKLVEKYHVIT